MLTHKKRPLLAVDAVIFFPQEKEIILIKRKNEPYKGYWALPGGFVEWGETVEQACIREVKEETSLDVKIIDIIGVFSDPNRDPRGHVISIAFLCVPIGGKLKASSDAGDIMRVKLSEIQQKLIKLAFDHYEIINKSIEKMNKMQHKETRKS